MTLREQVFRKMGWELFNWGGYWYRWVKDGVPLSKNAFKNECSEEHMFPPIDEQWEVCAKYLVPFMESKGYGIAIDINQDDEDYFYWTHHIEETGVCVIKKHDIPKAACKAFLEISI